MLWVTAALCAALVASAQGTTPCDASAFDRETCGMSPYTDAGASQSRIFYGETARPGEFPWQVALQYNGSHFCGGTILNRKFILTAAHCVQMKDKSYYSVVAGIHNSSDTGSNVQTVRAMAIKPHPNYSRCNNFGDIAVVKLQSPLVLSEKVAPACFPDKPASSYIGKDAIISGWGLMNFEERKPAEILQFTHFEVMPHEFCEDVAEEKCMGHFLTPDTYCVADARGNYSACYGDSGGPLVVNEDGRWVNIGVTSFGFDSCNNGAPNGYKSVPHHADWIRQQVEEM